METAVLILVIPNSVLQLFDDDDRRFPGSVEFHFRVRPRCLLLPTADISLDGGKAAWDFRQFLFQALCVTEQVARERGEVAVRDGAKNLLQTDDIEIVRGTDSADEMERADAKDVVANFEENVA